MATNDFLVEIGTEELPPKALHKLMTSLADAIGAGLNKAQLAHGDVEALATPRRLAVIVRDLADAQPEQSIERRGPAVTA
ncbi:MAG TPA: glycine--tRNA ligase subunit beta, partial [Pseudomonadales bacterium]|nr:glycine--tRNA ligase subunit beta [Pseudomonadales bacterium]